MSVVQTIVEELSFRRRATVELKNKWITIEKKIRNVLKDSEVYKKENRVWNFHVNCHTFLIT